MPATATCTLRINDATGLKGGVHSEEAAATNSYNQNYHNRFCACAELYNPHKEKGTMFQCMGLGTVEDGGCGEDWWHPECILGIPRDLNGDTPSDDKAIPSKGRPSGAAAEGDEPSEGLAHPVLNGTDTSDLSLPTTSSAETTDSVENNALSLEPDHVDEDEDEETGEIPLPPGFPAEDDFEHFLCYKCVNAFPWIKRYAGYTGFLPAVLHQNQVRKNQAVHSRNGLGGEDSIQAPAQAANPLKRKSSPSPLDSAVDVEEHESAMKKIKTSEAAPTAGPRNETQDQPLAPPKCIFDTLPSPPTSTISLFLKEDFHDHLDHCPTHFRLLLPHPHLIEPETTYSPPLSRATSPNPERQSQHVERISSTRTHSTGSKSLLEAGEAALMSNMDRAKAIEGVMAYNKLRDGLKGFLKPFAESGKAVSAEDIKGHFERLRGDAVVTGAGQEGGDAANGGGDGDRGGGDGGDLNGGGGRTEQSGY